MSQNDESYTDILKDRANRLQTYKVSVSNDLHTLIDSEGIQRWVTNVWPLACQTCGEPLGENVDICADGPFEAGGVLLSAHHRVCRPSGITPSGGIKLTSPTEGYIVSYLGDPDKPSNGDFPVMIVNPSCEQLLLEPDEQGGWRNAELDEYINMGFIPGNGKYPPLVDGCSGSLLGDMLVVHIVRRGRGRQWRIEPPQYVRDLIRRHELLAISITTKVIPSRLSFEELPSAFGDPEALIGRIRVENAAVSHRAEGATSRDIPSRRELSSVDASSATASELLVETSEGHLKRELTKYPALGDGVLLPPNISSFLDEDELDLLLRSIWRGDCQTCGASMVSGPIALHIEQMATIAYCSLHHSSCQNAVWDDSTAYGGVRFLPPQIGEHLTYETVGFVVDQQVPILIINPRIEAASLHTSGEGQKWQVHTIAFYREFHNMAPGGPSLPSKGDPAIGVTLQITDSTIEVTTGLQHLVATPGPYVTSIAREAGGVFLAISSAYIAQYLTYETTAAIMRDSSRTAVGWVPIQALPARAVAGAEYIVYHSPKFAVVGVVLERSSLEMHQTGARAWAINALSSRNTAETGRLIDLPDVYRAQESLCLVDVLSMSMYLIVRAEDGWRIVECYSRYGGEISGADLFGWANRSMINKSPHRVAVEWRMGPKTIEGDLYVSHALPSDK